MLKPSLHMVVTIAEHVCDDAVKSIQKLSAYRWQISLVKDQYLRPFNNMETKPYLDSFKECDGKDETKPYLDSFKECDGKDETKPYAILTTYM